jgi:dihydropteroate synthase
MPSLRRFKTQDDCRRAIATVYRELEKDQMDPGKARVLIYAALSISQILSEHDMEARVEALELRIKSRGVA